MSQLNNFFMNTFAPIAGMIVISLFLGLLLLVFVMLLCMLIEDIKDGW